MLLRTKLKNVTYNIGTGNPKSVNELVKILNGKKFLFQKDQVNLFLHMQISKE